MIGIGLLHGIDRKGADSIDAKLIDRAILFRFRGSASRDPIAVALTLVGETGPVRQFARNDEAHSQREQSIVHHDCCSILNRSCTFPVAELINRIPIYRSDCGDVSIS